ncbi:hypothetical protein AB1Y20_000603 [Prymnesium parvum]|uniref:SAM domain-containing protein n=1 Tax=Prymnesium parvum TaxID=97485 RepID=A0AB34K8L2_PRYPA
MAARHVLSTLVLCTCACAFPPRELEPPNAPELWGVSDVLDWVESIGFAEYRKVFEEASVDGAKLLGLTSDSLQSGLLIASAEHALAMEMELRELMYRRGLLSSFERKEHRRIYPSPADWGVREVVDFLEQMGLGKYKNQFLMEQVDGSDLVRLPLPKLKELLDVAPNEYEENERALELLTALIEQLKRRLPLSSGHDEL